MNDAWLLAEGQDVLFNHYYSLARRLTRSEGVLQSPSLSNALFVVVFT